MNIFGITIESEQSRQKRLNKITPNTHRSFAVPLSAFQSFYSLKNIGQTLSRNLPFENEAHADFCNQVFDVLPLFLINPVLEHPSFHIPSELIEGLLGKEMPGYGHPLTEEVFDKAKAGCLTSALHIVQVIFYLNRNAWENLGAQSAIA